MHIPLPPLLRKVFDATPLITYPSAELPASAEYAFETPVLYVYMNELGCVIHPDCLYWTTTLQLHGVSFALRESSPHAGSSLPFLLLPDNKKIPASGIGAWLNVKHEISKEKIYHSLVNTSIRHAYLYTIYLEDANFGLLHYLYASNLAWPVSRFVCYHARQSAASVLANNISPYYTREEIIADGEAAWAALSTLLGDRQFFHTPPGSLDAAVYSYAHLLKILPFDKSTKDLGRSFKLYPNLVNHRKSMYTYLEDKKYKVV